MTYLCNDPGHIMLFRRLKIWLAVESGSWLDCSHITQASLRTSMHSPTVAQLRAKLAIIMGDNRNQPRHATLANCRFFAYNMGDKRRKWEGYLMINVDIFL